MAEPARQDKMGLDYVRYILKSIKTLDSLLSHWDAFAAYSAAVYRSIELVFALVYQIRSVIRFYIFLSQATQVRIRAKFTL